MDGWVYRRGAKRTVPMDVLVMGMPRTGTSSMVEALKILGYGESYHMTQCLTNPPDCDLWQEAIDAKWYGKGKPYSLEEWDALLGHCQAVSDFPAAAFAFDLITTYPSAKVILNTRDPHAWYESASATVMVALRSPLIRVMSWLDPELLGRWIPMCRKLWRGYFGVDVGDEEHLTRRFMQHYEDVEMIVDKERLLIYRVGEGWGPLCTFLEKEMPDVPFPRVNESASFGVTLNRMLLGSLQRFLGRASVVVVPVVAAGLTAWFARGRMLW